MKHLKSFNQLMITLGTKAFEQRGLPTKR